MKLRHLLLGAGLGICTAVVVKQYVMKPYISSEKALRIVKSAFKRRKCTIDGSWIYTQPEPYNINGETVQVYKTGITRSAFGELEQYEVMVDAKTGEIVDVIDTIAS
nr:PepSY domain-containing protein [Bacillus subtilis]